MRVLLDECVTHRLRRFLEPHECYSAKFAGYAGLSNGTLLEAAESNGFGVLITLDSGIAHQQRLEGRLISLVVLKARSSALTDLLLLVPAILRALDGEPVGQVIRIEI